ncbi:MAG: pyruvate synthase subunit PorD [Thermodesulfobacteriota bacterium]
MAKIDAVMGWKELDLGCVIRQPGSSRAFKTGDWRSQRPVVDRDKCIKCGLCWVYCPDLAMVPAEEGYYKVNLDYCKGCGICAKECPKDAITMILEED